MSKIVFLTGASGFIGSHLLDYFLEKTDWKLICPCSWKHKGEPKRILQVLKHHDETRVKIFTHDLVAPFTKMQIKEFGHIDYILNFASDSHVVRSIQSPGPFIRNNVDLIINVLELARIIKPEKLIVCSTDEVMGSAPEGVFFKEWSPVCPSNPYSSSKAAQEAIAMSYWRTYDIPLTITNTVNNFGEMQDPEKYIAKLIKQIYKGEKVDVHHYNGHVSKRFYLYVKNHADAALHILKNINNVVCDGYNLPNKFNISSEDELDNLQIAQLISNIVGKPLNYELVDAYIERRGHDGRYALDFSKIKNTGWEPPFKFTPSLDQTVKWTLEHPEWLL